MSELKTILQRPSYKRLHLSVPSDRQRTQPPYPTLNIYQPTEVDIARIEEFDALAQQDIAKIAELSKRNIGQKTPLLEAAFEGIIRSSAKLNFNFSEFAENVNCPEILQAIELFLEGIWHHKKSDQNYYHVLNVASLAASMADKIYDMVAAITPPTFKNLSEAIGSPLLEEDANQLLKAVHSLSKEQFVSVYCASALLHDFGKLFIPTTLLNYDKILPEQAYHHILARIKAADKLGWKLYNKEGKEITFLPEHSKFVEDLKDLLPYEQSMKQNPTSDAIHHITGYILNVSSIMTELYLDQNATQPLLFPDEARALDSDPIHSIRTHSEKDLMHLHPKHAGNLIDMLGINNPLVKWIMDSAKYHHEKMDGSGYGMGRHGLMGENIPLLGRAMKIIDTFESMVSKLRRYKEPRTLKQAMHILANKQPDGTDARTPINEFDNSLVELAGHDFFSNFHEFFSIQSQAVLQSQVVGRASHPLLPVITRSAA